MSGKFPKPVAPNRGDGSAFINSFPEVRSGDVGGLGNTTMRLSAEPPAVPIPVEVPASVSRRQPKPVKVPMTYKHRETHYKRLKKISQALEVPMGDLIDEALEAKFAAWEAELASPSD